MSDVRRREFITLLGGAAVPWPGLLRAQQTLPVIGFLNGGSPFAPYLIGLRQGLKAGGYVEGQNILIEYRWAEGRYDRLPAMAAELVARNVRALVVNTPASKPAQAATKTVPIVFVVGADPVELGLVQSLNRPGGNLTGVVSLVDATGPKRVELVRQLLPSNSAIAFLLNPANPAAETMSASVQAAAHTLGQTVYTLNASNNEGEIDTAFGRLGELKPGALLVANDPLFNTHPEHIVSLAARHSLPAVYPWREYVAVGGLMSYGTSLGRLYQLLGTYVARILNGEQPANLPVQQSTLVELVVNLKTAKTLGLDVPTGILLRADEQIE